ncbi:MAG: hypothetical protein ACYC1L_02840 [Alphaproteobacteria bacterium]
MGLLYSGPLTADELSDAQTAEKAGQYARALQLYTAALGKTAPGSGEEQAIIEQAIGAARKTKPAPKAPDAAIPFEGRAEAIAKRAQSPADFAKAADEYRQALRVAPWVSSYAFNAGILLEKAERPAEAAAYLKLYLLAAPDAPDARDVQKKIAGLEYLAQQPAAAPKPAAFDIASIAGAWRAGMLFSNATQKPSRRERWSHEETSSVVRQEAQAQVTVTGTSVRITVFPFYDGEMATEFDGQYANGALSGTAAFSKNPHPPIGGLPPNYAMTQNLYNQLFPCGPGSLKQRVPFTAEINPAEPYVMLVVRGLLDDNTCRPNNLYIGSMLLLR